MTAPDWPAALERLTKALHACGRGIDPADVAVLLDEVRAVDTEREVRRARLVEWEEELRRASRDVRGARHSRDRYKKQVAALTRRERALEGALRGCALRVVDDGWCWCPGHHDNRATHQAHCILARAALATERGDG